MYNGKTYRRRMLTIRVDLKYGRMSDLVYLLKCEYHRYNVNSIPFRPL